MKHPVYDLSGRQFGELTVIKVTEAPKHCTGLHIYYLCKCSCGAEHVARGSALVGRNIKSCGCNQGLKPGQRMPPLKIIIGQKFGRLQVINQFKADRQHAVCICDCGNTATMRCADLIAGQTKSCGCLKREKKTKKISETA